VYSAYLDFLYRLGEFNIKLGLDTIRAMLSKIGNPHRHPRIIHIAGTNGKGSTLVTLERLLLDSGYTTGSTISPHLISFNERFRINGQSIDDERLNEAFRYVCQGCDINLDLSRPGSTDGELNPTFFEFALAMAFVLFDRSGVDFIILETGLGGRLDATNVIEHPLACVLTRIALDHQEYLGNTIEQITMEKLGILKKNTPVFVAPQQAMVTKTIQTYCKNNGYEFHGYPKDFRIEKQAGDLLFSFNRYKYQLDADSWEKKRVQVPSVGLLGDHQFENIMTALAVYFHVVPDEKQLCESAVGRTLGNLRWPGRMQYLGKGKKVLLDGAHNVSGMHALLTYLTAEYSGKRIFWALGWMKNKQFLSIFNSFDCTNITFIPMEIDNDRAETGESISLALIKKRLNVLPSRKTPSLVTSEMDSSLPDHDLLVVAGSLYLVGEFLEAWNRAGAPE